MQTLINAAGRSFLRAFAGALLILAPGVLSAPNLNQSKLLGIAALMAALAAGFKAIQVFIPQLSLAGLFHLTSPVGDWADSFLRAFLATFIVSLIGILDAPSLDGWRAAATAALVGAVTAGIRALQGALTPGEHPAPAAGLKG